MKKLLFILGLVVCISSCEMKRDPCPQKITFENHTYVIFCGDGVSGSFMTLIVTVINDIISI